MPFAFAGGLSNKLKFKEENPVYNQNLVLNSLTQTKEDVLSYSSKQAKIESNNIKLKFAKGKFKSERITQDKPGTMTFTYDNLKPKTGWIY